MSVLDLPVSFADTAHAANAYVDPSDPDGRQLVGVTTVIKKAFPPYLVPWASKLTAEAAVDQRETWEPMDRDDAVEWLAGVADRTRDLAGDKGTAAHLHMERYGRAIATGTELPARDRFWEGDSAGFIDAGLRFWREWAPEVIWTEATVFNLTHGYAGTADLFCRLGSFGTVVLDYKTGRKVYTDVAYQLAAYRHGTHALDADGRRIPVPTVDGGVVVHLKADGTYDLRPIECGAAQFERFLVAVDVAGWSKAGIIGRVVAPPAPVTVEDRRGWIIDRVTTIVARNGGDLLAQWWPDRVPTLKASTEHDDAQLDLIGHACSLVEAELAHPFPAETDPALVGVPGNDPQIQAIAQRLGSLPPDLVAGIEASVKADSIPRLSSGRCTRRQVDEVDEKVAYATQEHRDRIDEVTRALTGLADFDQTRIRQLTGWDGQNTTVTASLIPAIRAVADASATGYLNDDDRERLVFALYDRSKRDGLTAAKACARLNALPVPTSFATFVADPLLVALTIFGGGDDGSTPGTTVPVTSTEGEQINA